MVFKKKVKPVGVKATKGKLICSSCNAFGGELTPRSNVNFIHKDDKDCKRVREYREEHDLHETVEVRINKDRSIDVIEPVPVGG